MVKRIILQVGAFACYWLGIDSLMYRINCKSKRIITFHNVLPKEILPKGKAIGIVDDTNSFRKIVSEIEKKYRFSNNISDVSTVTITFDDGYKNQVDVAGTILKEMGDIPAIIFASGQNINNTNPYKALTIDLLLHWTFLADNGDYHIDDEQFSLTYDNRDYIWSNRIWTSFCMDSSSKGIRLLSILDSQYQMKDILSKCSDEYLRLRLCGITEEDITTLKSQGIEVGWHTYSHYPLSRLSSLEKKEEIRCPYPEMNNKPFSYPYGENYSVDEESKLIAENYDYLAAVSNIIPADTHNGYFMPRITLQPNKYMLHFELSGCKYFIKTGKTFPSHLTLKRKNKYNQNEN